MSVKALRIRMMELPAFGNQIDSTALMPCLAIYAVAEAYLTIEMLKVVQCLKTSS